MRFGLVILPEYTWVAAAPKWRQAEAMGFDHAWTFDHIVWGGLPESPWLAAMPTLTAAACVTDRIRLGTFVSSPNNHHPIQFMREILALDDISAGRFILGLGTGGEPDSTITGEDLTLKQRVARFHEFTALLDRLLREDRVSADGTYYRARDVRTLPGPVRRDQPGAETNRVPLIVAANGPKSVRLAVDRGDAWMTYGGAAETDDEWWGLVEATSHVADGALARAGRERHTLRRYLNLDAKPTFALASPDAFEDCVGRADQLGFTDVVAPWPRDSEPFRGDVATLEAVAADVLPRWR